MVADIPCCPIVPPVSQDASAQKPIAAPHQPADRDASPVTDASMSQSQPVVLQQPFSTPNPPPAVNSTQSQPQSPAHQTQQAPPPSTSGPGGGQGESDGEGPPRLEFADRTIKTLDEKLRNLLYQEYNPSQTTSSASDPPGSPPMSDSQGSEGTQKKGEMLVKRHPSLSALSKRSSLRQTCLYLMHVWHTVVYSNSDRPVLYLQMSRKWVEVELWRVEIDHLPEVRKNQKPQSHVLQWHCAPVDRNAALNGSISYR